MLLNKECVAMLLAGGQGSRLYALTNSVAKPAVSFGGKYRIIDFPLSNCVNSGIDTVGILTQYQPLLLNDYIGNGQPWDLDRNYGGVHMLAPYQAKHGQQWYKGTANAIYQNLSFVKRYSPEYVLILSGDHIYKMDYSKMLDRHKATGAACTIATISVPIEEASRFGIINADENGVVERFEEKPKHPTSTLASMGIYIFTAEKMYKYLEEDEANPASGNDFGHDVLPAMLAAGEKMVCFKFEGYWKDVGTISSLYEANMDLLGESPKFNVSDRSWRIYSRNPIAPPHYIGENGNVTNSIVSLGCEIDGTVENCTLSNNVTIKKGAHVKDSVIFSGCVIEEGAEVGYSILDSNVTVGKNATVGDLTQKQTKITLIGSGVKIEENGKVKAGDMVEKEV